MSDQPTTTDESTTEQATRPSPWELAVGPPPEAWSDWVELDPSAWPERKQRHYHCVPTICFNCESACGLLAFVDKETGDIQKFEGNPVHPGSRGRTCAKGPATINQVKDGERILAPLMRTGPRGSGAFQEVTWDEALDEIGGRIRKALQEDRRGEVVYHVGRPGEDNFVLRMLQAWGVDGHNSHTNVCSAGARLGYSLWFGADRPSPDYSQTKFMLLLSAHLETGHYFNPHAQRIMSAKENGARLGVVDTRLSNTASHADLWISPWPGSEAAMLLGVVRELLARDAIDKTFIARWTNWRAYLDEVDPNGSQGVDAFERFLARLAELYDAYTPEYVAEECKIPRDTVARLADEIVAAGAQFSSHLWRNTAAGNLGGWQCARALLLLHVITGSVGTPGGLNPNAWDKFVPKPSNNPPPTKEWNERSWPKEWPFAHYEMSFLLPHLLREQGAKIDTYFTRVYNPVWTNPDGCSWIEMLEDEQRIGCHIALTPIWSETAQWADYVLPMGLAPERHDVLTHWHRTLDVVARPALEKDHRVVVANRRGHQPLGVGGIRRHHHLEPRHVREHRLERLRVLRRDLHGRAARAAEHDRHRELPGRHLVDLRRVVDDLIDRDEREVEGHELDDRTQPDHGRADADAGEAHLRDRRVDHAPLREVLQQALRHLVRALVVPDLLAHEEDVVVAIHLLAHRLVERLAHADDRHVSPSP